MMPRRLAIATSAAAIVSAGLAVALYIGDGRDDRRATTLPIGGPFTLVDGMGRTVTERTYRGKWLLVYFGFTYCPDVCPRTLSMIASALQRLGPAADRVQALFITVDPERDTPQVLADYVAAFDPHIEGLTGTPEQIAAVAAVYRVYYAKHALDGDYTMDHTSIVYLMRPDGTFDRSIRPVEGADEMAATLRRVVSDD